MPKETKNEKIIESMNATPIIDTNVNIKIPRSPGVEICIDLFKIILSYPFIYISN